MLPMLSHLRLEQSETVDKISVEIYSQINEFYSKSKVTQRFFNSSENPLEMKIYIYQKDSILFSSFNAKIGDSTVVKSKVIKKEKAEEKYEDAISSGNAAIYVTEDPKNKDIIIINMGNIPAKKEVIFVSEFIHYTEFSKTYEFELFRNLPIFKGKNYYFQNCDLRGEIEIQSQFEINNIRKEILMNNLSIIEEKYQDDKKKKII
jgi:hypothetical protein